MSNTRNTQKGPGAKASPVNADDFVDVPVVQLFDTTAFVDLPIGFDPYWRPVLGDKIVCRVTEVDARDPKFVRFRFIAVNPVKGERGDKTHREPAPVASGEFFTSSVYGSIKHELIYQLQNSMKSGIDTPVIELEAKNMGTVKTGEHVGKEFYNFGMKCSREDKARLAAGREEYFKLLAPPPARPAIDAPSPSPAPTA